MPDKTGMGTPIKVLQCVQMNAFWRLTCTASNLFLSITLLYKNKGHGSGQSVNFLYVNVEHLLKRSGLYAEILRETDWRMT